MAADAPPKKEEAPKKDEKGKKPGDKDAPKKEVELSDEDAALKEALELMVTRASDPEPGVVKLALEGLRKEIRTATRCGSESTPYVFTPCQGFLCDAEADASLPAAP